MSKSTDIIRAGGKIQGIFRRQNSGLWKKALFAGRIKMKGTGKTFYANFANGREFKKKWKGIVAMGKQFRTSGAMSGCVLK